MKVLLVKMSSLGDVIHVLPALTDAKRAIPEIEFHWVVEERYQAIANWHPAVSKVIPIALRRWRKNWFSQDNKKQRKLLKETIRQEKYDLVIDAQGLIKSALVARLAKTEICGYSFKSAREPLASLFYSRRIKVLWDSHAIERMRLLLSSALYYPYRDSEPDSGLSKEPFIQEQSAYLLFFHGTTWENKHWPLHYWIELTQKALDYGFSVKLAWGNEVELKNSQEISKHCPDAEVLPDLDIKGLAPEIVNAQAVVAVDTGLAHLSAAFDVPTFVLFGPTDPEKSGVLGEKHLNIAAEFACAPCLKRKCYYKGERHVDPPCFGSIPPQLVWQRVMEGLGLI